MGMRDQNLLRVFQFSFRLCIYRETEVQRLAAHHLVQLPRAVGEVDRHAKKQPGAAL